MPTTPREPRQQCRHIFTDGHRCGSPCLRTVASPANTAAGQTHEPFCYFHHTSRPPISTAEQNQRQRRRNQRSAFALTGPEDRAAIQLSIGEVLRRIASGEIDPRRAGLLLYGLQIASLNLPRYRSAQAAAGQPAEQTTSQMVTDTTNDPILGRLALPAELPEHATTGTSSITEQVNAWRAAALARRDASTQKEASPETRSEPNPLPAQDFTQIQGEGA